MYEEVTSDDGAWTFVSAHVIQKNRNDIYSINNNTKEYFHVYANPQNRDRTITNICFFPKTKKLYFNSHNNNSNVHGEWIPIGHGMYTLQKDADGNYSEKGLKRYALPAPWILHRALDAYLVNLDTPDYEGFLSYLFSYADSGVTPVFCVTKSTGEVVTDVAALKYLMAANKIYSVSDDNSYDNKAGIEKYLFVADKNGKPTGRSAVTCNGSKRFYQYGSYNAMEICFAVANDTLYYTENVGSTKKAGFPDSYWSSDYAAVGTVEDDGTEFFYTPLDALRKTQAIVYAVGGAYPIESSKDGLVIHDGDGVTTWLYNKNGITRNPGAMEQDEANGIGAAWYHSVWIPICLLVLIVVLTVLIVLLATATWKTRRQRALISNTREDEKNQIAKDIHDSIVQNIRAIRIEAEMLPVSDDGKIKQNELVEDITQCIIKMRNICYGLSPAELSAASADGSVSENSLVSIIDTLREKFTTQTNIPCSLEIDPGFECQPLSKEVCTNMVRIIQEAFRNIEKHSYATKVQVCIRNEVSDGKRYLALFIIDDGKGCDLDEVLSRKNAKLHFGLRSMKERAKIMGGEIYFQSAKDDGMQIKLRLENTVAGAEQ